VQSARWRESRWTGRKLMKSWTHREQMSVSACGQTHRQHHIYATAQYCCHGNASPLSSSSSAAQRARQVTGVCCEDDAVVRMSSRPVPVEILRFNQRHAGGHWPVRLTWTRHELTLIKRRHMHSAEETSWQQFRFRSASVVYFSM